MADPFYLGVEHMSAVIFINAPELGMPGGIMRVEEVGVHKTLVVHPDGTARAGEILIARDRVPEE
jgi:hypothetical protein